MYGERVRRERRIDRKVGYDEAAVKRFFDALDEKDRKKHASPRRVAWRRKLRQEAFPVPEWLKDKPS